MSGVHALIPPSSAAVWSRCTGSIQMQMLYPETEESESARWGTAAHDVASRMIQSHSRGRLGYPDRSVIVGTFAENGEVITDEMFESAEVYADDVSAVMIETGIFGGDDFATEQQLPIPRVHAENGGTPDQWLFHKPTGRLFVWDFKGGFSPVEVFENDQLINYTAGILDKLGVDGLADQHIRVHLRVVQPRAHHKHGPVREWVVTASDLRAYINKLAMAAAESLGPNAKTIPGAHCKHCTARHACGSAQQFAQSAMDHAGEPLPLELTPEQVGIELANLKRAREAIEARESGLSQQAGSLLKSGHRVPNFTLEPSFGREAWTKPVDEIAQLGELFGVNLRKKELITPKQAISAGMDADIVKANSERTKQGLKLQFDDGSYVRRVFFKSTTQTE